MKLPTIQGTIHRRILANFRVDPQVMQKQIPACFQLKLHNGYAIAGICLIRLEHIRPKFTPAFVGMNSENAAHRVAVFWDGENQKKEGVFIARRDTGSMLNHLAGGKIFPGEHHHATFTVEETASTIKLEMKSDDGSVNLGIDGEITDTLPTTSIFNSLIDSSKFFEGGALGYSVTSDAHRLDGLTLETKEWRVEPLKINSVHSNYFFDEAKFPKGSIEFDHALLMRNVTHEWHQAKDLFV